jgi:hypothetical protein
MLSDPGFLEPSLFEPGKEAFAAGSYKRVFLVELFYSWCLPDNKDGGIYAAFEDRRRVD